MTKMTYTILGLLVLWIVISICQHYNHKYSMKVNCNSVEIEVSFKPSEMSTVMKQLTDNCQFPAEEDSEEDNGKVIAEYHSTLGFSDLNRQPL